MPRKLSSLPDSERRESEYDLDYLITKLSGMNNPNYPEVSGDAYCELILCLANEIQDLKKEIKF